MRGSSWSLIGIGVIFAMSSVANAELLVGLSRRNELVKFSSTTPGNTSVTSIGGLLAGEELIGLDLRPADGKVYSVSNLHRILTIDLTTSLAMEVGVLQTSTVGAAFGFDFNPVADRLRVVSDTGQNLRINVDTGAVIVDGTLNYAAGDPNQGATPHVTGAAYTNSIAGAMSTTLYDIDNGLNILATQVPPNNGTLTTVGSLGADGTNLVGFDISGVSGIAYAAMVPFGGTRSGLYTIDLATGLSSFSGWIGSSTDAFQLRGLTVVQPVPEPSSIALVGLGITTAVVLRARSKKRVKSLTE